MTKPVKKPKSWWTPKRIATEWMKRLRSGKFKQTIGTLCRASFDDKDKIDSLSYCCLGVLTDLYLEVHENKKLQPDSGDYLSQKVRDWAHISRGGSYKTKKGVIRCLSDLNDKGLSFKKIANIIEKMLPALHKMYKTKSNM